jgi:hypothetical protein
VDESNGAVTIEAAATSDTSGFFSFSLPHPWRYGCFARTRIIDEMGSVPYDGFVVMHESIVVRISPWHVLHGRVTLASNAAPIVGAHVALRHATRGMGYWNNTFAASNTTNGDGEFEIAKYFPTDLLPERFLAEISTVDNGFFVIPVEHDQLSSPRGADLCLPACRMVVQVEGSGGEKVTRADVRCASSAWGSGTGNWLAEKTSVKGEADFLIPYEGRVEVAVQADGFCYWHETVEMQPGDNIVRARMARRGASLFSVSGVVLGPGHGVAAGSYLSLWPNTALPEVGTVAMVHTKARDDGRYTFHIDADMFPCRLISSHPTYGLSDEAVIHGARDHTVDIVHRHRRDVVLHLASDASVTLSPYTDGPLYAFVVDRKLRTSELYSLREAPLRLRGLPIGSYNLAICSPGGLAYGHITFDVVAGVGDIRLDVPLGPAMWVRGKVLDASGRAKDGLVVRIVEPMWEGSCPPWMECRTSHGGSFRLVPCSLAPKQDLRVLENGEVIARGIGRLGSEVVLRVQ